MENKKIESSIEKPKFSLESFLNYNSPSITGYQAIMKETESITALRGGPLTDSYAGLWLLGLKFEEKYENLFKEKLKDKILVDLGGSSGHMEKFANQFAVSTYIDVDRYYNSDSPVDPTKAVSQSISESGATEIVTVKADMLDFIARLPNNSSNFTVNGIDMSVIKNPKYHEALAKELSRATLNGGIIISVLGSSTPLQYLDKKQFHVIDAEGFVVFEKRE